MCRSITIFLTLGLVSVAAHGAIPLQINHQGLVRVNGVPFAGNGHFRFALVDPDTGNNAWTNDGTNVPGPGAPTAAVDLPVVNGVYSVRLGDTSLTHMTPVLSAVFADDNLVLRIWFDDGINGQAQLSPDHVLTSAPYAYSTFKADHASAADQLNVPGSATPAVTVEPSGSVSLQNGVAVNEFSTDGTLSGNADAAVPTEKAVKTYVDSIAAGVVPIGGVAAWLKSFPNTPSLPSGWVECNGQVLNDAGSVYNGRTIPNLNASGGGYQRFLRGATSSGSMGGSDSHSHSIPTPWYVDDGGQRFVAGSQTDGASSLPSYYEVVWIMKVK